LIVNDSKGTNADATDMALGSFERIYWIAGGLAKEGGIEPLKRHFPKVAKAYLIGEAAPIFAGTLGDDVDFEISGTLDKALYHALEDARRDKNPEPVILMSPACASFDQFSSYAARGEQFRQLVQKIDGFNVRETS
jgi:UDP-N-acetylmuramoylalanine--D-glutamate ligase